MFCSLDGYKFFHHPGHVKVNGNARGVPPKPFTSDTLPSRAIKNLCRAAQTSLSRAPLSHVVTSATATHRHNAQAKLPPHRIVTAQKSNSRSLTCANTHSSSICACTKSSRSSKPAARRSKTRMAFSPAPMLPTPTSVTEHLALSASALMA